MNYDSNPPRRASSQYNAAPRTTRPTQSTSRSAAPTGQPRRAYNDGYSAAPRRAAPGTTQRTTSAYRTDSTTSRTANPSYSGTRATGTSASRTSRPASAAYTESRTTRSAYPSYSKDRTARSAGASYSGSRTSSRSYTSSATSARPVKNSAAASARYGTSARKDTSKPSGFKKVLSVIGMVFMAIAMIFVRIWDLIKMLNHKLDRFRKTEATAVVVNALLGGVGVILIFTIIALNFSSLRLAYGRFLASVGKFDAAQVIAQTAEKEDSTDSRVNGLRLKIAAGRIDEGDYDGALSMLALLPSDAESARLTAAARTAKGEALYQAGNYTEAAQLFDLLSDTQAGASRYSDCLCALAVQAYLKGDEIAAQQLLMSAGNADTHIENALLRVTGSLDQTRTLISGGFFSPDSIRHLEAASSAVLAAQSELPNGKIAAGNKHTVGLRADGTVVACGSNDYGQLNATAWTGIKMVAAGAYHTVGLRENGTVVACGDNSKGQLNVNDWTDIVMIAASEYDTLGLKSDGTVVSTGMHNYDVSAWREVTAISGGSYSAGCLYKQGAMRATHKGAQMGTGTLLASLSVCGAYSAGVGFDGSLISSFEGAPQWTDLVRVTATSTGILAITNTGTVNAHFFRASDNPGIRFDGSAVEIASSGTHHVILTADGRVYAFGANDAGQCAVSSWRLN